VGFCVFGCNKWGKKRGEQFELRFRSRERKEGVVKKKGANISFFLRETGNGEPCPGHESVSSQGGKLYSDSIKREEKKTSKMGGRVPSYFVKEKERLKVI